MKKKLMVLSGFVLGLSPVVALAQGPGLGLSTGGAASACTQQGVNQATLFTILCKLGSILNSVIPVLIALGVVWFVWGVVSYVIADDEEAKKKGRDRMIYGIIGLAVIVAVWGLVSILTNTFNVNNTTSVVLPTVPVVIPGAQ